jgi:hypothetical protein
MSGRKFTSKNDSTIGRRFLIRRFQEKCIKEIEAKG